MKRYIGIIATVVIVFLIVIMSGLMGGQDEQSVEIDSNILAEEKNETNETNEVNAKGIPILAYHTFEDDPKFPGINTTPEIFKEQLTLLKEKGYTTITTEQLQLYQKGEITLPEKSLMITIDDGYESVYEEAYPILKELDMKATLFLITSHIQLGFRFDIPMLSWDQIKEMQNSSFIEIGNHTHDLHWRGNDNSEGYEAMTMNMTKDGDMITDEEREQIIIDDLKQAEHLIEKHVGTSPQGFAYPYGVYDNIVEKAVKHAGYDVVHTTEQGLNFPGEDSTRLKRLGIMSKIDAERLLNIVEQYFDDLED